MCDLTWRRTVHGDHYVTKPCSRGGIDGGLCKYNSDCYVTIRGPPSVAKYDLLKFLRLVTVEKVQNTHFKLALPISE